MLKRISDKELEKLWERYEKEDPMQEVPFEIRVAEAQLQADIKATREQLVKLIGWVNKHTYINAETDNPIIELSNKDEAEWQKLCSIALGVNNDEDAVADEVMAGLRKDVVKTGTKKLSERLSKMKEVPLSSITISTGARDYGPPPDASERRM